MMLDTAREALKHGHKFFERTTKLIPGKFTEVEEVDPKTGRTIKVRVRVDREIVYIEHKVGEIDKMMMDGSKKLRMATAMTTEKTQAEFENRPDAEEKDWTEVDRELSEMFRSLGVTKDPKALKENPDEEPFDPNPGELGIEIPGLAPRNGNYLSYSSPEDDE